MQAYNSYKDSGVKWIGQIPTAWNISKIKYQVDINKRTLTDSIDEEYSLQYIDIGNVDSDGNIKELQKYRFKEAPSRARRVVKKDDILVSTVRTYLKAITSIKEVEDNTICSTGFAVLSPKQSCNADYLSYLIRSEIYIDEIVSRSTGVSYPAINASEIGDLECILPDLQVQKRIGDFLNIKSKEVEETIECKRKLIHLLEEKRQSIITEVITKGLNPKVKMKDSSVEWIEEIPEHWEMVKIKYLVNEKLSYGANEAAELDDENLPRYIRITDITDKGELKQNTFKSVPVEVANRYPVGKGDVLLARSGATVGKSYIHNSEIGASYAGYLIKLSFSKYFLANYIYLFTNSSIYKKWINSILIQATIQNVSAEKYGNLKVPIPPDNEIKEIVEYLNGINNVYRNLISKVEFQIKQLAKYRQSLIYEAVTGKIDVRELIAKK